MSKELIDKISRATGRYPVSCDCPRCRRQCLTPCLGTPEDIARAMVYLADAEFVTGQVLPVNGGFVIT